MNLDTSTAESAREDSPAAAAVLAELRAALARRRSRPLPPGLLRRRCFYAALPRSRQPAPEVRRRSLLGRLLRLAVRAFRPGERMASAPGLSASASGG